VAVVFQYSDGDPNDRASYNSVHTTNVFDCYTDGAFISLPSVAGNSSFRLEVFAYNRDAYEAAQDTINDASELGRRSPTKLPELATFPETLRTATTPTWTTECTATQQVDVKALASCDPLSVGLGGLIGGDGGSVAPSTITLDTAQFTLQGGRLATCANGSDAGVDDAGADADAGDVTDAGDAGDSGTDAGTPADAGSPLTFSKVRVRTRIGAQIFADETLDCPTPYSLGVAAEPAHYELDVGLLDPGGNIVEPGAQTLCTVTSKTGESSSAVCP
jgi:hypothetical protein